MNNRWAEFTDDELSALSEALDTALDVEMHDDPRKLELIEQITGELGARGLIPGWGTVKA